MRFTYLHRNSRIHPTPRSEWVPCGKLDGCMDRHSLEFQGLVVDRHYFSWGGGQGKCMKNRAVTGFVEHH
jgi:hypothetical protein